MSRSRLSHCLSSLLLTIEEIEDIVAVGDGLGGAVGGTGVAVLVGVLIGVLVAGRGVAVRRLRAAFVGRAWEARVAVGADGGLGEDIGAAREEPSMIIPLKKTDIANKRQRVMAKLSSFLLMVNIP
jgi:hypothetical protein